MKTARAQHVAVPKALLDSEAFTDSHYMSAYELLTPNAGSATPEQWGRAAFEGAPAPVRGFLVLGWTQVLRLRMGPKPSSEHVLGWEMSGPLPGTDHDFDSLVLQARSGLVTAHNVVVVKGASVLWATAVQFRKPAGRLVWGLAQPVHQLAMPRLLRRASRSIAVG